MDKVEFAVKKYSATLMRVAYTITHNTDDAQDAVQDAFVKYMTSAPSFLSDGHEKAWLIRVTINRCKNMISSYDARHKAELHENLSVTDEHPTFLYDAVCSLPHKYSVVIHLYYYEGYNIKEISGIVSITESAVATRLQRGREMLKSKIGDDFG